MFGEEYKVVIYGCETWSVSKKDEFTLNTRGSRNSVLGIAAGYGLDDRGVGVRVPVRSRIFSSPRHPDRLWGPPTSYSMGIGGKVAGA
jgi:hypothetical protein